MRACMRTITEKGDLEEPVGFVAALVHQQAHLTLTWCMVCGSVSHRLHAMGLSTTPHLHAVTEDLADDKPIANLCPGFQLQAILNDDRFNITNVCGMWWQIRHAEETGCSQDEL